MNASKTALQSHGEVDAEAQETYGKGNTILRIGNGGAGATGLVKALSDDYLRNIPEDASIGWVCNHSRNTQLALLYGYVDVALTYERDQETLTSNEGWSQTVGCAFHDHFCLAGPSNDPAKVFSATSLQDAFSRIAKSRSLFHSRADASATMWKERSIWTECGVQPWEQKNDNATDSWYKTSLYTPAEALTTADTAGAYLLTDRSTLLRQTSLQTIHNTTVFFEPTSSQDVLMNSCYALIPTKPTTQERNRAIAHFLQYLLSEQGQMVIANFGKEELGGFPLFAPVADNFSITFLKGGLPRGGQWKPQMIKAKI